MLQQVESRREQRSRGRVSATMQRFTGLLLGLLRGVTSGTGSGPMAVAQVLGHLRLLLYPLWVVHLAPQLAVHWARARTACRQTIAATSTIFHRSGLASDLLF